MQSNDVHRVWQDYIPTVSIPFWPEEASEWEHRKRKSFKDRRTGVAIRWPPAEVVIASTQCGGNLVPPQSRNNNSRLEWSLSFHKSEHLLLKTLNPAKLRLMAFTQLLWVVFFSSTRDVTDIHFRYLLWCITMFCYPSYQNCVNGSGTTYFGCLKSIPKTAATSF